jgi:hypothetical protein
MDVYAGGARFSGAPSEVGTANGALSLRYAGPARAWVQATLAAPLQGGDPWWLSAGAGRRLGVDRVPLGLGIDLGAQGHLFRDQDSASVGSVASFVAMPVLSFTRPALRVELRSGMRAARTSFLDTTYNRTVHDSELRADFGDASGPVVGIEARHTRASEGAYSYVGGALGWVGIGMQVWGSVGRWLDDALPGTAWSVGAQRELGRGFSIWASAMEEVGDPIYWNGARTTLSVGASLVLGRARLGRAEVEPVSQSGRNVTFSVPAGDADGAPAVVGDFNGWTPVAMARAGEVWSVTIPLDPGTYHFAFRSAEGRWFVPESIAATIDDGFGGRSALLVVH